MPCSGLGSTGRDRGEPRGVALGHEQPVAGSYSFIRARSSLVPAVFAACGTYEIFDTRKKNALARAVLRARFHRP